MLGTLRTLPKSRSRRDKATEVRGRALGLTATSTAQVIRLVEAGLPYRALVRFHKASGLPIGVIARLTKIPPRTLIRRKAVGRLRPEESERLLRIAGVFERALALFEGEVDATRRWLTLPRPEFDDQAPLDFARSELGAREVEDLIGRLEHGVFA